MVNFEVLGKLGIITLDRVKALNALTKEMIGLIYQTLMAWQYNPEVHVVLIRSASQEVFCAGGDIRSVYEMRNQALDSKIIFFETEYQLDYLLSVYPKPVISLMNGITMGGGVGLAMHVAFPIAGEKMIFAMPETAIGFFPDVGGSALLNQLPLAWQNFTGVFGQRLNAKELLHFKLVHSIIPCSAWDTLVAELIAMDWGDSPFIQVENTLNRYSIQINDAYLEPLPDFQRLAATSFAQLMTNVENACEEAWENFKLKVLALSPLSMNVAFIQLQHARNFDVKDALGFDFYLLQHFLELPEFYEGVRAMIIDKDKNPNWSFADWRSISPEVVAGLFDFKNLRTLHLV